ncbi:bifunctional metallophosphatase/5'-nucleotidase [Breznakiella homolactica]|uniref:Metallophosphatase n=1 Tax=Breznakiella homolactica TaxID=2798577 RepID=A0A7T8BAW4_9SPIR|nr:metallophosphatase [Breznakiella homolactica]QQO09902.1 metallophosphatase [Breznakiella homolactica]
MEQQVTLVFLNDTHSHLYPWKDKHTGQLRGGAARWSAVLKNIRSEGRPVLFFHSGDIVPGSDFPYLVKGSPNWERLPIYGYRGILDIQILNMLGLNAATLGNHEFDYGLAWIHRLFGKASFDIISANVIPAPVPETGEYTRHPLYKPYAVYTAGDLKIGVTGLTTDEYLQSSQVRIADPVESVRPIAAEIKKDCDLMVVISHLGVEKDRELAQQVPEIDVILGGHDHILLEQALTIGRTSITQTRSYGEFLGRLDIRYDGRTVADIQYSLVPLDSSVPEDPEIHAWLLSKRIVGTLNRPIEASNCGQSSMGEFAAALVHRAFPCDAVILKSGNFQGEIPAGPVSPEQFFSAFWPYKPRRYGPEKDLLPEQIMDIIRGKAAPLAKHLLLYADGVTALIRAKLSADLLQAVYTENETLKGQEFYLQINEFSGRETGGCIDAVIDFQAWVVLYRQGILSGDYPYEVLPYELFEVLLKEMNP